ncbi:MAG: hypothetical protein CMH84_15200 [Nocardioides sp.]|nr:hypothetical protein [Nocardioides sp.]|tara:strand:- start:7396 stop:8247 length:852 start_codon:yes stop_codon:yes gene_type:complete
MRFTEQAEPEVRMKAFASDQAPGDNEWPDAWALVEVEPQGWMCTLPLHELVDLIRERATDVQLRGLSYAWIGQHLAIELGPASVVASAEEWLSLCRRLLDAAGSTQGLYELPGTQPWSGPTVEVAIGAIALNGEQQQLSPTAELAALGRFGEDEFVELFGMGWNRAEASGDQEFLSSSHGPLYLWGTPPQLGAALDYDSGALAIGIPRGSWGGHQLRYELDSPIPVTRTMSDEEIDDVLRGHLRRRRRSFGWCRYCGEQVAPEHRYEPGVCHGCARSRFGVVY